MSRDALSVRLLAIFLTELEEQLVSLNAEVLGLESSPEDPARLGAIFRIVHTLKGAAHAAHVPEVEEVCHALESLLSRARERKIVLGVGDFSLLFDASDALGEARQRLAAGEPLAGSPLDVLRQRLRSPAFPSPAAEASSPTPPPSERRATPVAAGRTLSEPDTGPGSGAIRERLRVEGGKLDALGAAAGELRITAGRIGSRPGEVDDLHALADRSLATWTRAARRVRLAVEGTPAAPELLRALEEVEDSLNALARRSGSLAAGMREDTRVLTQAAWDMTDRVRRLRMRPFSEACLALPRAVRDLSSASGKEARLEVAGGTVEADRAVLDVLREVLLHLVRNAVDHGLETPAERERVGKPRTGTVTAAAAQDGQRLVVTVRDDGRGLDLAAVRAKLVERGVRVPETDEEVAAVIFRPGFSTRGEATAISGRGVGLDAVATAMERIRGTARVDSEAGRGTSFTLECSPTLATVHSVLVAIGSQVVAVPSAYVEHLQRADPAQLRRAAGRTVLLTGKAPVPLVSLARVLGPPLRDEIPSDRLAVVHLAAGGRRLAVAVDEFLDEEEVVVRSMEGVRGAPPLLSGAALLTTGKLALVLNAPAAVDAGLARPDLEVRFAQESPVDAPRKRILVADDSITTRTLEQSILEAAGYDVVTAVDGADAWRLLHERPVDLLVSDVEMPRMDGFGLCAAVRGSQRLARLPVVLVTALDAPEHRVRGLEAGADAYLPKSSFDHQDLLDTVQQLLG